MVASFLSTNQMNMTVVKIVKMHLFLIILFNENNFFSYFCINFFSASLSEAHSVLSFATTCNFLETKNVGILWLTTILNIKMFQLCEILLTAKFVFEHNLRLLTHHMNAWYSS